MKKANIAAVELAPKVVALRAEVTARKQSPVDIIATLEGGDDVVARRATRVYVEATLFRIPAYESERWSRPELREWVYSTKVGGSSRPPCRNAEIIRRVQII